MNHRSRDYQIGRAVILLFGIAAVGYLIYGFTHPDNFEVFALRTIKLLAGSFIVGFFLHLLPNFYTLLDIKTRIAAIAFVFVAIFGGEVLRLYTIIPQFDSILHLSSGSILAAIGFQLFEYIDNRKRIKVIWYAVFGFSVAMTVGVLWEVYEFLGDALLNVNMQRYDGLFGQHAIFDTMKDVICNAVGSISVSIYKAIHFTKSHHQL